MVVNDDGTMGNVTIPAGCQHNKPFFSSSQINLGRIHNPLFSSKLANNYNKLAPGHFIYGHFLDRTYY